jgi:diguanylate cyclase (GGDEF)-like protein
MVEHQVAFPFSTLLNMIVFAALGVYGVRHRRMPGAAYFAISTFLIAFDSLASMFELSSHSFAAKLFWRNVQQIPLFLSGVIFLALVLDIINVDRRKINRYMKVIVLPAIVYLILIWTDSFHHLMRVEITLEPFGNTERIRVRSTYLSMLFQVYARVVGIAPLIFILFNLSKVGKFYRRQYLLIIAAILIPFIATFLSQVFPINVAISTIPTGILLFYALFKYKLLLVRPLAREKLFEVIQDGIIVVDNNGTLVDINPAGLTILKQLSLRDLNMVHGRKVEEVLQNSPRLLDGLKSGDRTIPELSIYERYYSVSMIEMLDNRAPSGKLLIFTDITERRDYEAKLWYKAAVDGLTQVYNRQYFLELINQTLSDRHPENDMFIIILLDIDHFKNINDSYGHHVGDLVLERFARILKEATGATGMVGRLGGEEFAIALPHSELEHACVLAENIRLAVQKDTDPAAPCPVTVSIGMVWTVNPGVSFQALYQLADEALYDSKQAGRNRLTIKDC